MQGIGYIGPNSLIVPIPLAIQHKNRIFDTDKMRLPWYLSSTVLFIMVESVGAPCAVPLVHGVGMYKAKLGVISPTSARLQAVRATPGQEMLHLLMGRHDLDEVFTDVHGY